MTNTPVPAEFEPDGMNLLNRLLAESEERLAVPRAPVFRVTVRHVLLWFALAGVLWAVLGLVVAVIR